MPLDPVFLGMLFLSTALIFMALVFGLPWLMKRMRSSQVVTASIPQGYTDTSAHTHAVLIVQAGGRVNFINSTAREWLELHDGEQPNLENLARHIRPSDEFLKLCTS